MAKGLILCHEDEIFAGESAGFGLPVLKTARETIFPSLVSSRLQKPGIIESVYHLNLINAWQIAGVPASALFSVLMEKIVDWYMCRPKLQSSGLKLRNRLFQLFRIRSTMIPGTSSGYCRVIYRSAPLSLTIEVNASGIPQPGQLILLNEVPGSDFSRMITNEDAGCKILDGTDFLPWQTCTFGTAIEKPDNPDLKIGFFLSVPGDADAFCFQVAAGREVGRDLNWAGLSLATDQRAFTYQVNFYSKSTETSPKS
jgi:hypothetical protein